MLTSTADPKRERWRLLWVFGRLRRLLLRSTSDAALPAAAR